MSTGDRVVGAGVVVVAGVCFAAAAWLLVPWASTGDPVPASSYFSGQEIARAEHFSIWARVWSWSALALHLVVLSAFLTRRARAFLGRVVRGPRWWRATTVVLCVTVTARLATLPLAVAAQQHRLDHGLSVQPWWGWGRDMAVSWAVSTTLSVLAVLVLLAVMGKWRRTWPLVSAGLLAATVVVSSWGYPLVVEPLFNSFTPMASGDLRDDITELAEHEDVELDDVLVADASRRTTTLNAYVSGIGTTRRVVVYDTLVEQVPSDQVLAVVAHELAHARHRDVVTGTGLGALGAAVGAGLLPGVLRRRDVVAVVTTALAFSAWAGVAAAPVENGISRQIERRADQDALKATGDPVAFREVQVSLALRALADPTPPALAQWWWGSHPTVLERLSRAG